MKTIVVLLAICLSSMSAFALPAAQGGVQVQFVNQANTVADVGITGFPAFQIATVLINSGVRPYGPNEILQGRGMACMVTSVETARVGREMFPKKNYYCAFILSRDTVQAVSLGVGPLPGVTVGN